MAPVQALLSLCLLLAAPAATPPGVVDEVLAVVGRTPILASDLELARLVHLAEPDPGEAEAAFRSRLLDTRIRLELQYRDLERSGVLYRLELAVDPVRARLEAALGGAEAAAGALAAHGLSGDDMHELALRIAAAAGYAEQRLRPTVTVTREEVVHEYERFVAAELAPSGIPAPPLEELVEPLRRVLEERKLNAELERWTAEARRTLGVTRFAR